MTLTGGFDLTLQLADGALSEASARMHAEGMLSHRTLRSSGGELFDLVFGPPLVTAAPPQPDGLARVVAHTRMCARARPVGDPSSAGRCAVALTSFRARLDPTATPGQPLSATDRLRVDWSETSAGDVSFQRADPGFENALRTAILEMTQEDTGAAVPLAALADRGVRRVIPCTVAAVSGGAAVTLGLDLGGGGGAAPAIEHVVRRDWAIALSRSYALARLNAAVAERLGGAPPPAGSQPVVLDDQTVCVLQTPLGCAARARRRLLLRRLELDLAPGRVLVQGTLAEVTEGPFGSDLEAGWSAEVTFQVGADGSIGAQIGNTSVQLSGVLASFANFFSGGALERAVRDAIVSQLEASFDSQESRDLVGALLVRGFGETAAGVAVRAVELDVRPDGLVLHGVITTTASPRPPVAAPTVLATRTDPLRVLLSVGDSWSPGGELASVGWDLGPAEQVGTPPTECRLAVAHDYPAAGSRTVCLELTDAGGRTTRTCQQVEVGILRQQLVAPGASEDGSSWRLCASPGGVAPVDVVVTATGTRIPGVTVALRAGRWSATATTDGRGLAHFDLDVSEVGSSPAPGGTAPRFSLGGFDVEVSAPGWVSSTRRAWLVDCAAAAALRAEALRARDLWIDRLAGYSALERIRDELGLRPGVTIGLGGEEGPPQRYPPYGEPSMGGGVPALLPGQGDPRRAEAAAIGATLGLLDQLTKMIALTPSDPFSYEVLGIAPDARPGAAIDRISSLWRELDERARGYQASYGDRPRRDRPR